MSKAGLIATLFFLFIDAAISAGSGSEVPIRVVTAVVEKHHLREVLENLRKISDSGGFAVRISQSGPDPEDLFLQMWRDDMKVFGADASDTGAPNIKYSIAIFRNCNDQVPTSAFDEVAAGLQKTLGTIPGVISISVD